MLEAFFKALGEPTRLRIVRLLAEKELCVCELEEIMEMSQPRISQHLKVLKHAGLINERREAQKRMCSLNWEGFNGDLKTLQDFMHTPLDKIPGFTGDAAKLKTLSEDCCKV
ncbi:MAG: ArsR/SmtB family transcription factor [Methylocystaceae bacterium]